MTTEQNAIIAGSVVGAMAGAIVSFMFFTERGRAWRVELERNAEMLARESEHLFAAVDQVRQGVAELKGTTAQSGWSRTA